jgi:protease-4
VDSPGGSAAAAEEIRSALAEARSRGLPIVVSMSNVAASGGYWVSTAGDLVFAEPSTITGSIGVFGILPSFEETLAKIGVTSDGVKATALSGEPNVVGGVSPEFDALAQASVEDIYGKFIGLVATSRKLTPQRVDEIGQGRVWDGGTAHQLKLVDRFGGLEDAVAEAAKRASLSGDAARARYFDPELDDWAKFLAMFKDDDAEARASARPAVRDWLSYAARAQEQMAVRIVADLRSLVEGPSIRADCLECRIYTPVRSLKPAEKADWLSMLVQWTNGR